MNGKPPFERLQIVDTPQLVGARWWQESVATSVDPIARRKALIGIAAVAIGVAAFGACIGAVAKSGDDDDDDQETSPTDSLAAQQQHGWSFGSEKEALVFEGATGAAFDPAILDRLVNDLAPKGSLRPYYVPTLFQSITATPTLGNPSGGVASLRDVIRPIRTSAMDIAFARGAALASLFEDAPAGKAVIIDLPGPEAVAFAAGLADRLEPVFVLDNWPHPRGVVPAHLTLAAVAYYAQHFVDQAKKRPDNAPPVFVLDSNRLAAYNDQSDRFDNRYFAKLPSTEAMKSRKISQILYIRETASDTELDDLNPDFVDYQSNSIEVKLLPTVAFVQSAPAAEEPVAQAMDAGMAVQPAGYTTTKSGYYYGGPTTHWFFWSHYGWGTPRHRSIGPPSGFATAPSYRPIARPTMFGSTGSVKSSPSNFAKVGVVKSKSSGRVVGGSWGRSGSVGS